MMRFLLLAVALAAAPALAQEKTGSVSYTHLTLPTN